MMASNEGYVPYIGVSIFSMLENNTAEFDKIHIYIIDNGISEESQQKLLNQSAGYPNVVTTFHDLRERLSVFHPKVNTSWDNSIFGRVFIDDVVEEGVEKALYVDGDTIVNHSLRELLSVDMGENCIAGVTDFVEPRQKKALNMADNAHYINSGVLLVNIAKYREFEAQQKIINFVNTFDKRLVYPDQDAINAVCGNKIHILPPKYNFGWYLSERKLKWEYQKADLHYSYEDLYETAKDNCSSVVVFHFFGTVKPWMRGQCAPLFENIWKTYNERSAWKIKRRFQSRTQMLKFYFITLNKRRFLAGAMRILGKEQYDRICGLYEEHWGIRMAREKAKRKGLL